MSTSCWPTRKGTDDGLTPVRPTLRSMTARPSTTQAIHRTGRGAAPCRGRHGRQRTLGDVTLSCPGSPDT
jgi:hypothetical protein